MKTNRNIIAVHDRGLIKVCVPSYIFVPKKKNSIQNATLIMMTSFGREHVHISTKQMALSRAKWGSMHEHITTIPMGLARALTEFHFEAKMLCREGLS